MPAILLVDDHTVVRQGLKQILAEEFETVAFGEAQNGEEALVQVSKRRWDVVMLDVSLPARNGLEVLQDIRDKYPGLPVLLLSVHPEQQYAVRALKSGAAGYITKDAPRQELVKAIRKAISGGKYVSASLAEALASSLGNGLTNSPEELLSNREYEVMRALASGGRIKEIAQNLGLSVKTVSTYRRRLLDKMKMVTNAELTRYAMEHDLLT
jgi:DNA-binding NarL/FixJ family response regulator